MEKNFTYTQKATGDTLSATEWNNLAQDVDAAVDTINHSGLEHFSTRSNRNDLQITVSGLYLRSYYGGTHVNSVGEDGTTGESLIVSAGHLELNSEREIVLNSDSSGIFLCTNNSYNSGPSNGGNGNFVEYKIHFAHGGGGGLEFGTFDSEKSSLFTNEYRFNKNGIIKLATRNVVTEGSNTIYETHSDGFSDNIAQNDPTCTWEDIVTYVAWAKANRQGPWETRE